jgi:hypothetical protein
MIVGKMILIRIYFSFLVLEVICLSRTVMQLSE